VTRGARALGMLALVGGAGCAPPAVREQPPCPAAASAAEAICARDAAVNALRARFRAEVEGGGETRSAEGVLVWRAPGEMRVKLFTLAGITVYDAVLRGDASRVRGAVRQPLADRVQSFDLGPGETEASIDVDLALVLWALWQPRCASPPAASGDDSAAYRLDARSARASGREVVVRDGEIREEVLIRATPSGGSERVVARYEGYDCAAAPPLPRRIALEAPASGWRARVTILEQARNVALDDGLFALPEATGADAGS